jgi:hypothetical protein
MDLGASGALHRQELVALIRRPARWVLPRLTGDGGEYVVEVTISVE